LETADSEAPPNAPSRSRAAWIVERSFAWLGCNRRLSKDYEYRVQTSELMIDVATTRLMLNRLTGLNDSNTLELFW
jgi:putative transposase